MSLRGRWRGSTLWRVAAVASVLLSLPLPAAAQGLTVHVDWTKDHTVSPALTQCSTGGLVAGNTTVRVRFVKPAGMQQALIKELRVREGAGHTADMVVLNQAFNDSWGAACGARDPDPLYHGQFWGTTSGHNGSHTITVTVEYNLMGQPTAPPVTQQVTVDVRNLLISATVPANPEPVKWDPDTMATVRLSATVSAAYLANQPAKLTIYDGGQGIVRTQTWTVGIGGLDMMGALIPAELVFDWNGSVDDPLSLPNPAPKGVYFFRWEVGNQYSFGDTDSDKSSILTIGDTSVEFTAHDEESDQSTIRLGYVLTDSGSPRVDASAAEVRIYDPDLAVSAGSAAGGVLTNAPGAAPLVWNYVSVQTVLYKPGDYAYFYAAFDFHAAQDKGHRNRPALQKAPKQLSPQADNYDFLFNRADNSAKSMQKLLRDDTVVPTYTGAYAAKAWAAQAAAFIVDRLPKDRLFYFNGHGGETPGVSTTTRRIKAEPEFAGDPDFFVRDLDLRYALLIVWHACKSGQTWNPGGNLLDMSVARGAKCAVGFTDCPEVLNFFNPTQSPDRQWCYAFWRALARGGAVFGRPECVSNAIIYGRNEIRRIFGRDGGYDTCVFRGDGTLLLVPAR